LMMAEIQQRSNSYIYVDSQDMCAYIYGSKPAKAKAKEMLSRRPEDVDVRWRIYRLRGPGKSDTFATEALKRLACPDITCLMTESGNSFDYQVKTNDFHESYIACKVSSKTFETISKELDKLVTDCDVECAACCCPVESTMYVTETCGHAYCYSCIESQLKVAVENRFYPIKCALQGCEQPLSWLDIANICDCRGSMNKILNISLSLFVAQGNGNRKIKFCPTPDCSGLFLESKTAGTTLPCYECKTNLCTYCGTFSHLDISCSQFQRRLAELGDIDMCVKMWMALNFDIRKICPNCKMGIEKDGGCNNVNCRNCHTYVCWKCLNCYARSHQCYDHLREVHGGLFDD
jgi:hypothetical protein